MHRIQVQLTKEQERMLKDLARLRGESISALIREGIEHVLDPERERRRRRKDAMLAFIGCLGPSPDGATDVSERHDDYLADIIERNVHGEDRE
jgi:hypothetical protein